MIAVCVGTSRELRVGGRLVRSAIHKTALEGRVRVGVLGVEGDAQADRENHGGPDQALCAYPLEHYAHWAARLPIRPRPPGSFGENLTLQGLLETEACIGDVLRVGSARLQISQPRIPCAKLPAHLGAEADFVGRFLESGRVGFYLRVLEEGELGVGDALELVDRGPHALNVRELLEISHFGRPDVRALERAATLPGLSEEWRERLGRRLVRRHAKPRSSG